MALFFDQYYIDEADTALLELNQQRDYFLKSTKNYLLLEHYFFGNLFNITLPTLRRPDLEILQELARAYLAETQKSNKLLEEEGKI